MYNQCIRRDKKVRKTFEKPSLTKQSFKEECDVNNILKKFAKTGLIEHVNRFSGDYGNYTSVQDYQTSLNQIMSANEMFESLPSKVRARFGNNPAEFLDFVGNPENIQEMISLGLASKRQDQVVENPPPESK